MRRRDVLGLIGGLPAYWPLAGLAQNAGNAPRIGFLGTSSPSSFAIRLEAFRQGLRDFGYREGATVAVEYRWAEGRYEQLPALATELVRSNIDVIVTHATPGTLAAKQATAKIPIVMALVGDPVASGLVASIAKPGGNITGQSFFNAELRVKRLELLKEVMPRLTKVAVILNPDNAAAESEFKAMEAASKSLSMELRAYRLRNSNELVSAFGEMERAHVEAVETGDDQVSLGNIGAVTALAARGRLLTIGPEDVPRSGGTLGYGIDAAAAYRHVGSFVDKLLKGASPADIPVERASKFQFILNLKTTRALDVEIPAATLLRADEVIE